MRRQNPSIVVLDGIWFEAGRFKIEHLKVMEEKTGRISVGNSESAHSLKRRVVRTGIIFWLLSFAFYTALQSALVHYFSSGDYAAFLMPGKPFGVPAREAAAGMKPVTSDYGWDGQFYYYLANDPLLTRDAKEHMDEPIYRAQRIGYPMLVHIASQIWGENLVSPWLYLQLGWLMISLALGCLAGWLVRHGVSPLYSLIWGLWYGMWNAQAHGLPDGVGDAWFLLAILCIEAGFLVRYVLCATMMVLTREGYAAYTGMIVIFTLMQSLKWGDRWKRKSQLALVSLPCLIVFGWTKYLEVILGESATEVRSNLQMTDYPFTSWLRFLRFDLERGSYHEMAWKITSMTLLLMLMAIVIRFRRSRPALTAAFGYLCLITMLGDIVWVNYIGYPKAMSSVWLIGILAIPNLRLRVILPCTVLIVLMNIDMIHSTRIRQPMYRYLVSTQLESNEFGQAIDPSIPKNKVLQDYRCEVEWIDPFEKLEFGSSIWNRFHRQQFLLELKITNRSNETWYPNPENGAYSILADARIIRNHDKKKIFVNRAPLGCILRPGESTKIGICMMISRGEFTLVTSLTQDQIKYFPDADPSMATSYPIEVVPSRLSIKD
jgi:hypothetical protein